MEQSFETIDDILDFAIASEQEAVDFYNELAESSTTEDMKKVFAQFAREEIGHKTRLTKVKKEGAYHMATSQVRDLKISDYLVEVKASAKMTYEEALIVAMKREKSAFKLYLNLAEKAPNKQMQELFHGLAQEESKHKLRFELEYDEYVLREN
ncbi:MAG: ferritin family protein [Bacteroidales bacterium]|jgi:rubrerythrin